MKKNVLINIRIEDDLKDKYQVICERDGYTMSEVMTASIRDVVKRGRIPLNLYGLLPRRDRSVLSIPEIKRNLEICLVLHGFEDNIKSVSLFGSYAKGTATFKSDLDFLVECDDLNLFSISALEQNLKETFNKDVDVVVSGNLDPEFLKVVNREKIIIYERQDICLRS